MSTESGFVFIDFVRITVEGGRGGNGVVAFRREKFVPKGGPAGGDGGNGGSVILTVNPQLHTLQDIRYHKQYKAQAGRHGEGSLKNGRSGQDLIIQVPPGTLVKDEQTDEVIADLQLEEDRIIVARGGQGGRGNAHFATPTHQTPRRAEEGKPGEFRAISLELKLLADVGLVGFPNAGKSTLLSVVSRARPKVADYPFTTLVPNLGIVKSGEYTSFLMADIPGLIEGAHKGKGLGDRFLRHVERTKVLLFLVDVNDPEPVVVFEKLVHELSQYNDDMLRKPRAIALTKIDAIPAVPALKFPEDIPVFPISSLNRTGLDALIKFLAETIAAH
ncbi:MAG: GTPase ObgE [Lentisphaeria bacterium]|nr:GTPase ObgE [Candidatus Neomarinimicrobiota bacterium]MCF7841393.1 GTPase ObgE [Lentisphaeria bacterium]